MAGCGSTNQVGEAKKSAVEDLVVKGWDSAQRFAEQSSQDAKRYLDILTGIARGLRLPDVVANFIPVTIQLDQLVLPEVPQLGALPVFGGGRTSDSIDWTEVPYESDLLDLLRNRLTPMIEGDSTGLAPEVEARLWERARNREHIAARAVIENVMNQAAGRGWRRPPGAMLVDMQRALQDERIAVSGASREIAIKQAELEQSNRQFAIKAGWDIEAGLQDYIGKSHARALDAAKFAAELINAVYKLGVERYLADVKAITDIFKARGDVYQSTVQGQAAGIKAQADAFGAQVEYSKAEALTKVEVAKANVQKMLQAIQILSDIAKSGAQVSAQMTASALSAVNLSGGLSSSGSVSDTNSSSSSCSESFTNDNTKGEGTFHTSFNYNFSE